jgi:2-methylcitrate dehydratase PrpD
MEAQLSLPFAVATAVRFNDASLARFSESAVRDPNSLSLCQLVEFSASDDWPIGVEPAVRVRLKDGRVIKQHIRVALGDPRNPMTTDAVVDKFRSLTEGCLSTGQQDRLVRYGLWHDKRVDLHDVQNVLAADLSSGRDIDA